jgi:hypothetical protein
MIYFPIVKTRDAELRGVCWLADKTKTTATPLFELTRSRKTKKASHGPIEKRLETIAQEYGHTPFGIDLTSFVDLKNEEIEAFYDYRNGFGNWVSFVERQQTVFPSLIPTLIVSDEDIDTEEKYVETHKKESENLSDSFQKVIYRIPGDYDAIEFDLDRFFEPTNPPIVLLDMGFIPKEKGKEFAKIAEQQLMTIHQPQYGIKHVILAGSSFPKDPTENNGGNDHGENILEEVIMFEQCRKTYADLIYGDYATINPLPNERAGGNGWVPRIDFPTEKAIIYHRRRKKKNENNYAPAYIEVARTVVEDDRFSRLRKRLGDQCWGISQILLAAEGYPPSMAPAFWISVRIHLHITLQCLIRSKT